MAELQDVQIFLGTIIHSKNRNEIEVLENSFIIVEKSKIIAIGEELSLDDTKIRLNINRDTPIVNLTKSQILIPGLVDAHIHAPQYPNCGLGYDKPFMEWLDTYSYPLEAEFSDLEYSRKVYKAVVKRSLSCGTTTACYFGTTHNESCNILVDVVLELGQRALIGKVNMTKLAPEEILEKTDKSISTTMDFIKYVQFKKSDLVKPIITPRFPLSLDMDLMKELSSMAKCNDLHIQTHIAESRDVVDFVQNEYGMPYAYVYDQANLLTPKTILAHGIFLSDDELKLISRRGTSIAHCPDANLCLKSGVCDVKQLWDHGISVGLGTDVSAGSHPSILKIMKLCLYSTTYVSYHIKDSSPLSCEEVFYLGTLGGSEALSLQADIGNFEINKQFDALIVDLDIDHGIEYLIEYSPKELLHKFIYCADDRNIVCVYVAGKLLK